MKNQAATASLDPEIELNELFKLFWAKKRVIVLVMVFCTVLTIALTSLIKPVYQAKVIFGPPITSDLAGLAIGGTYAAILKPLGVMDAYNLFQEIILSDSVKKSFLKEQHVKTSNSAHQSLVSVDTTLETANRVGMVVKAHSREDAFKIAQEFMDSLQEEARKQVSVSIGRELSEYEVHYQQELALALKNARQDRENQIIKLKEALNLAQSLNFTEPMINKIPETSASNPAYLRGTTALAAEINSLENRTSDEPFSERLHSLIVEHENVTSIQPNLKKVLFARVDEGILVSESPIKHKQKILIALSVLVGFFLGCLLVFLRNVKSLLTKAN